MPRSFELHLYRNRDGLACGYLTRPDGSRTEPRVLGEVAKAAASFLATYLCSEAEEWLQAPEVELHDPDTSGGR